ncbi:myosuppressin [Macrosteles quadrilineatus]|uniref:myosuppressin n=1 Tax=Macrosteles quadrilineatus TaxID=74068 RepID=UPI0023E27AA3|nr:myosuppressin [Macrosteles quadrilineatus]
MKCCVVLAAAVLSLAMSWGSAMPPPPQCTPGLIEEIPLRMRKVCAALSTIYELSNAMESYLDDKGGVYNQMMRPESSPLMENGVKRQDVDHVFLRFGRRR